jgi:hypothetical protein
MTAQQKYPYINQDCVKLDEHLKGITFEISDNILKQNLPQSYLNSLKIQKGFLELNFISKNCKLVLEKKKLEDSAKILYNESIKQEDSIIKKNYKEQYLYIGFGAIVLLVGLFIVKKQK